jgi:hypothetical protein
MAMSDEDLQRERRIANLSEQMLSARTPDIRRKRMEQLLAEIRQRTPCAVRHLEQAKGLL